MGVVNEMEDGNATDHTLAIVAIAAMHKWNSEIGRFFLKTGAPIA